jgi:hypothetical protein
MAEEGTSARLGDEEDGGAHQGRGRDIAAA